MNIYVIIALVFVACFFASFGLLYFLSFRKDPVRARLKAIARKEPGGTAIRERSVLVQGTSGGDTGGDHRPGLKAWLASAGYRGHRDAAIFYQFTIFGGVFLGLCGFGVAVFFDLAFNEIIAVCLGGALVGLLIPRVWVTRKIARRRDEIRRAVPNLLDLVVVCVEAGLSFTAALHRLANETKISSRAMSEELRIVTHEILVGKTKVEAFKNLANRTKVEELRLLAITLIQSDKLGTSIASSLRVLAESMRFRRRQRAEEMANKTTVKLVFPLVFLIFPELLVILVGPALIRIIKTLTEVVK